MLFCARITDLTSISSESCLRLSPAKNCGEYIDPTHGLSIQLDRHIILTPSYLYQISLLVYRGTSMMSI
jgi:hypothetical protein